MKKRGIFGYFVLFALALPAVFASEQILEQLQLANESLITLEELNFSTQRYSDVLFLANQLYDLQIRNNGTDFAAIEQKLAELTALEDIAYIARDEVRALEFAISSLTLGNMSLIYESLDQVLISFRAERYEETLELVDVTYTVISDVEASETRVRALYDATTRTIGNFIKNNWMTIAITFGAIVIIYLVFRAPIKSMRIKRKLYKLHVRENAIQGLIAKNQKEYFDKGSIGEASYGIRMKKYRELLREIHRQIPLLHEEFALTKQVIFNPVKLNAGDIHGNKKENSTKKGKDTKDKN